MKDLSIYFQPVDSEESYDEQQLGSEILIHRTDTFPELDKKGVAILFTPESRRGDCSDANDSFRNSLYELYIGNNWTHRIYDLGTISPGNTIDDTLHAIQSATSELIKNDIIPILIGGSQDLTIGLYSAYEKLEQLVNLTTIDDKLDIGNSEEQVNFNGWLTQLLLKKPCYLFNYSNLGAQSHYIAPKTFDLFNDLYFDIIRLGELKSNIQLAEPTMRNTDIVSFDLQSIISTAWNASYFNNPNGLDPYSACGIMRYAGISDKLTSIGLFNQELLSTENQTGSKILAQLIWYFNEGYANRKGDFPIGSKKSYTKYRVHLDELNEEIVFCKSDKSGRWWMEVPYPSKSDNKFMRHQLVPCSYEIYKEAMNGDIPDLWWKTYQKIS
jgi:arginase family enzyme